MVTIKVFEDATNGLGAYSQNAFGFIESLRDGIEAAAAAIGVSKTAVAGAMAEERHHYDLADSFLDVADGLLSLSHETIVANYIENYDVLDSGPFTPAEKIANPVLRDLGFGNIQLGNAIRLIEYYFNQFGGTDPLDLNKYRHEGSDPDGQTGYDQLVADLTSDQHLVTARLYAVQMHRAEAWFQTEYADWESLPQEYKDALLVSYSNLGPKRILEARDAFVAEHGFYRPVPAMGTGGGIHHLLNAATIGGVFDSPESGSDYGSSVAVVSIGNDTVTTALLSDETGLAYRYALVYLRPIVVVGVSYSDQNEGGALDLYDVGEQPEGAITPLYVEERFEFLKQYLRRETSNYPDELYGSDHIVYDDRQFDVEFEIRRPGDVGEPTRRVVFLELAESASFAGTSAVEYIYGGRGKNVLSGGEGGDYLEAGLGDDTLYGGLGNDDDGASDTLIGGPGDDRYYAGDGDVIIDTSGTDVVHLLVDDAPVAIGGTYRKVAPNVFRNEVLNAAIYLTERQQQAPGAPVIEDARLVVFGASGPVVVTLEALVVGEQPSGRYGITLENYGGVTEEDSEEDMTRVVAGTASGEGVGSWGFADDGVGRANRDDLVEGTEGSDELYGVNFDWDHNATDKSGGRDYFYGRGGNDLISSGGALDPVRSYAHAGEYGFGEDAVGADVVPGDEGDFIDAGEGDDIAIGADGDDVIHGGLGEGRDFLNGRHGNDILSGWDGNDVLLGGRGDDILIGGAEGNGVRFIF